MSNVIHAASSSAGHPAIAAGLPAAAEDPVLTAARQQAQAENLPFAGSIHPLEAWRLVQEGSAVLVDVRTAEERKVVGYIPDSLHVAWSRP